MTATITCPSCRTEIEITEAVRLQLAAEIRNELESGMRMRKTELEDLAKELGEQQQNVKTARAQIDQEIRNGIEAERKHVVEEATRKAREDVTVELQDRDERLVELERKLKESLQMELQLRRRERELQSQTEQLELEVARQLEVERESIRNEARQQYAEQHQLKDAEKEKQISDLRKQIDELKRKAEQGSQQIQGEVQEVALEELLKVAFPTDTIDEVAKGVRGGDIRQQVLDGTGLGSGTILWESKRTKHWSDTWLEKARDDQREARAACVVIVSEALPEGVRHFTLKDGVWICSWSCAVGLAAVIRVGLIEVGKSKLAVQGQHGKMEMAYHYISGSEFHQRVSGVVEAVACMQSDLDSEKRSTQRLWAKREKQIQRALMYAAMFWGDLQGIIGASLAAITELECNADVESNPGEAKRLTA